MSGHQFNTVQPSLRYVDCNASIGANTFGLGEPELTLEGLVCEMDHAGVDSALVTHFVARQFSPKIGNRRLLDAIETSDGATKDRIVPCAVFCPYEDDYLEDPREVVHRFALDGFRAARVFPAEFNVSLDPRLVRPYFEAFAREEIPLFVEAGQIEWSTLIDILEAVPELPVVLSGEMYRSGRIVVPLLKRYANFFFEVCGFETHRGVEELVNAVGARQLMFGSRIPEFSIGPARMMIDFALIDDDAKADIAGANLERLIGAGTR